MFYSRLGLLRAFYQIGNCLHLVRGLSVIYYSEQQRILSESSDLPPWPRKSRLKREIEIQWKRGSAESVYLNRESLPLYNGDAATRQREQFGVVVTFEWDFLLFWFSECLLSLSLSFRLMNLWPENHWFLLFVFFGLSSHRCSSVTGLISQNASNWCVGNLEMVADAPEITPQARSHFSCPLMKKQLAERHVSPHKNKLEMWWIN